MLWHVSCNAYTFPFGRRLLAAVEKKSKTVLFSHMAYCRSCVFAFALIPDMLGVYYVVIFFFFNLCADLGSTAEACNEFVTCTGRRIWVMVSGGIACVLAVIGFILWMFAPSAAKKIDLALLVVLLLVIIPGAAVASSSVTRSTNVTIGFSLVALTVVLIAAVYQLGTVAFSVSAKSASQTKAEAAVASTPEEAGEGTGGAAAV